MKDRIIDNFSGFKEGVLGLLEWGRVDQEARALEIAKVLNGHVTHGRDRNAKEETRIYFNGLGSTDVLKLAFTHRSRYFTLSGLNQGGIGSVGAILHGDIVIDPVNKLVVLPTISSNEGVVLKRSMVGRRDCVLVDLGVSR